MHVCTANYLPVAESVARRTGHPDHPIVVLPEATNGMGSEELDKCAERILREGALDGDDG